MCTSSRFKQQGPHVAAGSFCKWREATAGCCCLCLLWLARVCNVAGMAGSFMHTALVRQQRPTTASKHRCLAHAAADVMVCRAGPALCTCMHACVHTCSGLSAAGQGKQLLELLCENAMVGCCLFALGLRVSCGGASCWSAGLSAAQTAPLVGLKIVRLSSVNS